jgi:hypothetical protein
MATWRGLAFLIRYPSAKRDFKQSRPGSLCPLPSSLSNLAVKMSAAYNYQYPPSSWPAAGSSAPGSQQGHSTDGNLTNYMASMALTGGATQNQPPKYGHSQQTLAGGNVSTYPHLQTQQSYGQPAAPTSNYAAAPPPYGAPSMPFSSPQANAVPQNQGSGYPQAPSSPYLVSTTSIQPSPGSVYNVSATATTSTPGGTAPSANHPPSNYGGQYPSQYNAAGSGAQSTQQAAAYVQASQALPQFPTNSADKGKGV